MKCKKSMRCSAILNVSAQLSMRHRGYSVDPVEVRASGSCPCVSGEYVERMWNAHPGGNVSRRVNAPERAYACVRAWCRVACLVVAVLAVIAVSAAAMSVSERSGGEKVADPDDHFDELLGRWSDEAKRWEKSAELTAKELADMRTPYATGSGEDLMWKAIEVVYWKVPADDPRPARTPDGRPARGSCVVVDLLRSRERGLHQFFFNYTGYLLPEAIAGAELLGETDWRRPSKASSYLATRTLGIRRTQRGTRQTADPATSFGSNSTAQDLPETGIPRGDRDRGDINANPTRSSCRGRRAPRQNCRSASGVGR